MPEVLRNRARLEGDIMTFRTDPCPGCGRPVLLAFDAAMNDVALDPDPAGGLAVAADANHVPWCRPVGPCVQLALGEDLYRLHACPLARVLAFNAGRARRRYAAPNRAGEAS